MNIDYDRLFCFVDDFLKGFEPWYKRQLVSSGSIKRNRSCHLSLSEIITILLAYHQSGMSCFKYFYLELCRSYRNLFPGLVHKACFSSISVFVEKLRRRSHRVYVHRFDSYDGLSWFKRKKA